MAYQEESRLITVLTADVPGRLQGVGVAGGSRLELWPPHFENSNTEGVCVLAGLSCILTLLLPKIERI